MNEQNVQAPVPAEVINEAASTSSTDLTGPSSVETDGISQGLGDSALDLTGPFLAETANTGTEEEDALVGKPE